MLLYVLCTIALTSYTGNYIYEYYIHKNKKDDEPYIELNTYPKTINNILLI